MTNEENISQHFESTAELIDQHVKEESTTGVSNSISSWIKTLDSHKEFADIAASLKELKMAITEKNEKQIVSLMTKLGSDTTKAAENSENADSKKIKMLGKALSAGAKGLSKLVK